MGANDHESRIRYGALSQLEEGIALARQGEQDAARAVLKHVIHNDPENEDAWLWLAWVAEGREDSLRLLQEAQTLLPDSIRIREAIEWARQELGQVKPQAQSVAQTAVPARRRRAEPHKPAQNGRAARPQTERRSSEQAVEGAAQMAQGAGRALNELKSKAERIDLSAVRGSRGRQLATLVFSSVAIVALLLLTAAVMIQGQQVPQTVKALELPAPLVDETPTLTMAQRTQPLWTQVDISFTQQDWDAAIEALLRIRSADPQGEEARARLAEAYYGRGRARIAANDLDGAYQDFDEAVRLDASSVELQQARRDLRMYSDGLEAYWQKDWLRAVERLTVIYERNADFRDTKTMLSQAYYQLAISQEGEKAWEDARDNYRQALALSPDLQDAETRLAAVLDVITPPRRIEVSLSEKTVKVYEQNTVVRQYICCTGRAAAPTVAGRYEIQSKMPSAYASKWDLDMPWWLGIYWAGGSENGFHALPILSNGTTLWRGSLGTGCSYGCIVLDTEDAKELYDWAGMGDVVFVNP